LFDNGNEEDNQPDPDGAPVLLPDLPRMEAFFSEDVLTLHKSMDDIRDFKKQISAQQTQAALQLQKEFASLPPWKRDPYVNEQGDLIVPYNYEPYLQLFERITLEFHKRDLWLSKQMAPEEMDFWKKLSAADGNMFEQVMKCKDQTCICTMAKPAMGLANSDLSGMHSFWGKWKRKWEENWNWYITSTSAVIKKVHYPQLNQYLNNKRAFEVRNYVQDTYETWLDYGLRAGGLVDFFRIDEACVNDPPKTGMAAGDEVTPSLKKLKTWPEKCNVPTGDYDFKAAAAGIVMTCDELRLRFGALHVDTRFGEKESNDVTRIYFGAKWEKSGSTDIGMGGHKLGEAGAGVEVKGEAFITIKNRQVVNWGVEGNADASASASVKSGNGSIDKYLPGGTITASGQFIISAETGIRGSMNPVEATTSGLLQNIK
jgi:hypothetical protein